MKNSTRAYVNAAEHAQSLGADGVEVHAAHGYLMDQFLWAQTNQRDDEFGGPTLAHRARYPALIVAAIRKATGSDFTISFRFSQFKEVDYGAVVAPDPEELRDCSHCCELPGWTSSMYPRAVSTNPSGPLGASRNSRYRNG